MQFALISCLFSPRQASLVWLVLRSSKKVARFSDLYLQVVKRWQLQGVFIRSS
jgi:hypothetical protein